MKDPKNHLLHLVSLTTAECSKMYMHVGNVLIESENFADRDST